MVFNQSDGIAWMTQYLDAKDFLAVVRNTPLVSIDLIVTDADGRVLVGHRKNAPAKDFWFVPGGRIYKNETLDSAFSRISQSELGCAYQRKNAHFLGNYDHIYDDNFAENEDFGTHYVVIAYQILVNKADLQLPDIQHGSYIWILPSELIARPDVHLNTKAYFL